jgi:DNA polymerase-3 subunit alpha
MKLGIVEKVEIKKYKGRVYDLEVENDKSYNINGNIVHNSVSASLVTFLMGITKLDPIRWKFIFERFINPARKTRMKVLE